MKEWSEKAVRFFTGGGCKYDIAVPWIAVVVSMILYVIAIAMFVFGDDSAKAVVATGTGLACASFLCLFTCVMSVVFYRAKGAIVPVTTIGVALGPIFALAMELI